MNRLESLNSRMLGARRAATQKRQKYMNQDQTEKGSEQTEDYGLTYSSRYIVAKDEGQ